MLKFENIKHKRTISEGEGKGDEQKKEKRKSFILSLFYELLLLLFHANVHKTQYWMNKMSEEQHTHSHAHTSVTMQTMEQSFSKKRIAYNVFIILSKWKEIGPIQPSSSSSTRSIFFSLSVNQILHSLALKWRDTNRRLVFIGGIFIAFQEETEIERERNKTKMQNNEWRGNEVREWVSMVNFKYARQNKQWATECD